MIKRPIYFGKKPVFAFPEGFADHRGVGRLGWWQD